MTNTIGQKISVERLKRRVTQESLASDLGIAQSFLSDIENDKVSPKWDLITTIADKFEIPVSNLLPVGNNFYNPNFNDASIGIINHYENKGATQNLFEELIKAKDEIILAQKQLIDTLQKTNTELK